VLLVRLLGKIDFLIIHESPFHLRACKSSDAIFLYPYCVLSVCCPQWFSRNFECFVAPSAPSFAHRFGPELSATILGYIASLVESLG
jgi:hypothetical protein